MNDPSSDKVFDALLEEMLTDQHPPDLSAQIQTRFREELGRLQADQHRPVSAVVQRNANRSVAARSATNIWRTAVVVTLSTAAALLMAVGIWQLSPRSAGTPGSSNSDDVAVNHPTSNSGPVHDLLSVNKSTDRSIQSNPVGDARSTTHAAADGTPSTTTTRPREAIALDNLPFNIAASASTEIADSNIVVSQPVDPWSDDKIVTWVDGRFRDLWSRQQVEPQHTLGSDDAATRLAWVLTGEAEAGASTPPSQLAGTLLRSARFAEHWADRTIAYWLRGTPAADGSDAAGAALRAAVAQQIVARKPWNEIIADLIASQPDKPEAAFLAGLAGGNNHRLASRIGSVVLDEALACARCHDASENGRVISIDQDQYWSLVAMLTGVDAQAATGTAHRTFNDRQQQLFADRKSPNVFFERPDGRLQAAHYRLPAGDHWRTVEGVDTPRQSLARWIATTTVTDEAAVNLAWRIVFGRPLVAQHAALDGVGLGQRREILTTLAAQFQAHDRDMAQLVGWIVASRPFVTEPLNVDRQAWLLASEAQIARWNVSAVNFATYARAKTQKRYSVSLDGALASALRWSDTGDERRATLAQPTFLPKDLKGKNSTTSAAADEPPATYLVRSLQPTAAQQELIGRLVKSRLTWPQQVEHIAGLIGEAGNNSRLQVSADQLLKSKNGDKSAALFQLLQCAVLYEES